MEKVKNMELNKTVLTIGMVLLIAGMVTAQTTVDDVTTLINDLICRLVQVLYAISAAVATVVIVIAGIKWIGSSEDAGARAQAKSTIIHALIGLIIVIIALSLVNWTLGSGTLTAFTCTYS